MKNIGTFDSIINIVMMSIMIILELNRSQRIRQTLTYIEVT